MKLFSRKKDIEDVQSLREKGIDLDVQGKFNEALNYYNKALNIDPNSIYVLINKGNALGCLGRRNEALDCYNAALELDTENIDALINKALTLHSSLKNDEVLATCDQILQKQPYNAQALHMKGVVLQTVGKFSEAKTYLENAAELDPKFDPNLSDLLPVNRTVTEKAISYYDKQHEIDRNNEDALANKALALANLGKYKQPTLIEEYFIDMELKGNWRVIAPTPTTPTPTTPTPTTDRQQSNTNQQPNSQNWELYSPTDDTSCEIHLLNYGGYREIVKFKNGANVLVTPTRIRYNGEDLTGEQQQPLGLDDLVSLNVKGRALNKQGKYQEAIICFDTALDIEPNDLDALFNKGLTFQYLGKYQEAVSYYDKALVIEPNNSIILKNKGSALALK
jgi:tetratricopeptide (TPR) repeat protein